MSNGQHRMADDSSTDLPPRSFFAAQARIKAHKDFAVEMGLQALAEFASDPDHAVGVALCHLRTGVACIADINAESIGARAGGAT